jgi:hypothetical protein
LITESIYCHRATSSTPTLYRANTSIVLTCQIETYPSASIKWFIGMNDLAKLHTKKDNHLRSIKTHSATWLNATTRTHTLTSYVSLVYAREQLYNENFTCRSFFKANTNYFVHSVLFEVRGEDSAVAGFDYLNPRGMMGVQRGGGGLFSNERQHIRNMPFIYWIILAICLLFSLTVVVFALVCIVRSNRNYARNKRATASMINGSGGGDYYYDSVNKRSAIYMRSAAANYSDGGTLKQPLKPIVIRDHQDYSSIYSDVAATTSNNHQSGGGNRQMNCSSLSTTLTSSTPNNNDTPRYSRLSANTSSRRLLAVSAATGDQSFDHEPADRSFLPRLAVTSGHNRHAPNRNRYRNRGAGDDDESTASSGGASSKLFEENFEEYKDPKFDDLSKPAKGKYTYLKPPSSSLSSSSVVSTELDHRGGSSSAN